MAITHVALSFVAPLSLLIPLQKGPFFLTSAVLVEPFSFFFSFPENSVVEKGAIEIGGGGEGGER